MLKGDTTGTRLSLRQHRRRLRRSPTPLLSVATYFFAIYFPVFAARAVGSSVCRSVSAAAFWGIEFLLLFSEVADLTRQRCTRRRSRPTALRGEAGREAARPPLRPPRPFRQSLADERRKKESSAGCCLSLFPLVCARTHFACHVLSTTLSFLRN